MSDTIPTPEGTPAAPAALPAAFDDKEIELPACFYLGQEYDPKRHAVMADKEPVMYPAEQLTTHGVIVGMTGSGKTGLAISILEEAIIDGIPCIMIDPKGDLGNLTLQFPGCPAARFQEWLNDDDAKQKKLTTPEYAQQVAERWKQGLAESRQPLKRINILEDASRLRIYAYTPGGGGAALPLSVLGTFAAPKGDMPHEALTQKIDATASALLGLTGVTGDPLQSREHVLIAQLLLHAWTQKRDLDLPGLILQIQNPPMQTIGAYNLETFYPARERLRFASTLNNVLASPSFATWITGETLDLDKMLYGEDRKPQQLIFYTAHLDDTQRMFFTTLLLAEVLAWTRRQTGTKHLRALLYFDEVFGYMPPYPANPPSKIPLLTLLKQARAFGVGVLLATQNPVDLDYKALSNAGTWFIGKLQTERDRARLLDGLESVAAEQGTLTDRSYLEALIPSLGNRVFLMHNIHNPKPILFQSRWTLSFLRGPMTREDVSKVMKPLQEKLEQERMKKEHERATPQAIPLCSRCFAELGPDVTDRCPVCGQRPWANDAFRLADRAFRESLVKATHSPISMITGNRLPPVLPPDVTQFYLPPRSHSPLGRTEIEYQAAVLGIAEVAFLVDKRKGKEHQETVRLLAKPAASGHPINWEHADSAGEALATTPLPNARWANVPDSLDTGRKLKALEKAFGEHLYSTRKLSLYENRALELVSEPGESLDAFQKRCRQAAAEEAGQALAMEKAKFAPRFKALDMDVPEDPKGAEQSSSSFLGWLFSRNPPPPPKGKDLADAGPKERKLIADYQAKQAEIHEKWKRVGEDYTPIQVKPRKVDVRVTHFGLAWVPTFKPS